jgi:DNA polymerase-3 subunit delta'
MTPQAANAFLKTLEEPPSGVTIILATESLEKLLPTIRSRCTSLACPNVTDSDIRQWISEKTGTPYEGLISHAMISYIEKTGHFPHDIVTLETIQGYTTSDKLQLAENLAKDKFLAKLAMQQWLEECVAAATTTVSPTQANQTAQILLTHIKNSHYNLNTRLQLEALLFGLNA